MQITVGEGKVSARVVKVSSVASQSGAVLAGGVTGDAVVTVKGLDEVGGTCLAGDGATTAV